METETDHLHYPQSYAHSCPDISFDQNGSQDIPTAQMVDHNSISFGRYEMETLAWEKFSVFCHNRNQEELEKFKAPGLVAQKKAYFEEYYKRVRDAKALQEEQEETTQATSFEDAQCSTTKQENVLHADIPEEGNKLNNVRQIQISDNANPSRGSIVDEKEQKNYSNGNIDKGSTADKRGIFLYSMNKVSLSDNSSIKRNSKIASRNSCDHNRVERRSNQPSKQEPAIWTRGTLASAANKTKLDCRIRKEVVKQSGKPKSNANKEITIKSDDSLVSGKRITPNDAGNNKANPVPSSRQVREVKCSATVHTSLTKDKIVSSSSRGDPVKAYSSSNGLANKLPAISAILVRSAQTTLKETNAPIHSRKSTLDNRNVADKKSLDRRSESGESGNLRPKVTLTKTPVQNVSNQNIGLDIACISAVKGVKQRKGIDETNAGLGRDPKLAASKVMSIHKTSYPKVLHKSASSWSLGLTLDRRDSRQKMPIWK